MQRQAPVAASEAIIILSSRNRSGVFGNCMELINTDVSRYCISGVIVCTSLNQIWALANSLIKLCSFLLSKIEGDLVRFAKRKEREMNPVQIYVIFFRWNLRYKLYVHYIMYIILCTLLHINSVTGARNTSLHDWEFIVSTVLLSQHRP